MILNFCEIGPQSDELLKFMSKSFFYVKVEPPSQLAK